MRTSSLFIILLYYINTLCVYLNIKNNDNYKLVNKVTLFYIYKSRLLEIIRQIIYKIEEWIEYMDDFASNRVANGLIVWT